MWEVAIHLLSCETERIEDLIKKLKHRNDRQMTSIKAMNDLNPIPDTIKESIVRLTKDIEERNVTINDWSKWKDDVNTEIEKLKKYNT